MKGKKNEEEQRKGIRNEIVIYVVHLYVHTGIFPRHLDIGLH